MSKPVSYHGAKIREVTVGGQGKAKKWNEGYCREWKDGVCVDYQNGYYSYRSVSSKVKGSLTASVSNVYVNSKKIATRGDTVKESWSAQIPSGWSNDGSKTSGNGKVSQGSSSVYANSKGVAYKGSQVQLSSGSTTINEGSSNVFTG